MINVIRGIEPQHSMPIIENIRVVTCEASYALAVIVAVMLIPFALLLRVVIEIKIALGNEQNTHHFARSVSHL